MSYISPSVNITEIDASAIVPTIANNIAVFCGDFEKGPVGVYTLITTTQELEDIYGLPNNQNYNSWYQVWNFLQYSGAILVARASDMNGTQKEVPGLVTGEFIEQLDPDDVDGILTLPIDYQIIPMVGLIEGLKVGDLITFGEETDVEFYKIIEINGLNIKLDRIIEDIPVEGTIVSTYTVSMNATIEAVSYNIISEAVADESEYVSRLVTIGNFDEFEMKEPSLAFVNPLESKLKFYSRNPGKWGNDISIAIAVPADFGLNKFAFDGIALDDLFEYFPVNTEVGVIVKDGDDIVETYTVDFDQSALNSSGKSAYIETVINRGSAYIYVKDNTTNDDTVKSYIYGTALTGSSDNILKLVLGSDSKPGQDDIMDAYALFENLEEVEVDIIIANEVYPMAAIDLATKRKDCIAFIGARYEDTVGKKSTDATKAIVDWRKTGEMNVNSMFACVGANYKYQYLKHLDKFKWVNMAGDIAGLRGKTSSDRASWWASAGLERGQILNATKLAFSPNVSLRDSLYKNGLNPIVSFPGLHKPWLGAS